MKLTKKLEAEVLEAYHSVWNASFKGDMKSFASMLDENCHIIGSSAGELFSNKKSALKFYKATAKQITGKVELRNRKIELMPVDKRVMVNEESDFYLLIDNQWTFYGHARISSLFHKKNNKWKVIHQHASFPDSKTDEGEQINAEKIKAENLQLRDAVKRRTFELENKNRELEVEAALEKVRSRSLAMVHSDELNEVVAVVFEKLQELQFGIDGAAFILTPSEDPEVLHCWIGSTDEPYPTYFAIPKYNTPIVQDIGKAKELGRDFFSRTYSNEEKNSWFKYAFEHTDVKMLSDERKSWVLEQPCLTQVFALGKNSITGIHYHFEKELTENEIDILKRFCNAFEQSYTRFLDLKKAEAQARESQIQLALERVRARTMAMQKSEELSEVVYLLFQQFKDLGESPDQATIGTINENDWVIEYWVTMYGKQMDRVFKFSIDEPNVTHRIYKAWKEKKRSLVIDLSGRELIEFTTYRESMGGAARKKDEKRRVINVAFFSKGLINVQSNETRSTESIRLLERFSHVFDQTYTRFLDLKKAEAQAREAQIEGALERVRSRTMAMHRSEEIADILGKIFEELKLLDVVLNRILIWIFNPEEKYINWWSANSELASNAESYRVDYNDHPVFHAYLEAWQNRTPLLLYAISGATKASWEDHLFNNTELSKLPAVVQNGMRSEGTIFTASAISDYGLLMSGSLEPLSDENTDIIQRFGKVFQQSYTRYLDVQKAEAQAREARIEAALERVRSRTMAMQRSEELAEVATVLFQQVKALGVSQWVCGFSIWEIGDKEFTWYPGSPDGEILAPCKVPLTEHPVFISYDESRLRGDELFVYEKEGEFQADHYRYMMSVPGMRERLQNMLDAGLSIPTFQIDHIANFSHGNLVFITYEHFPEMHDIFKRFAKVFDLTYTRFLDLQKAEAQTREARIEAALERVRAKAMSIRNSEELAGVGETIFSELKSLGFADIRNTEIIINNIIKNRVTSYYYSDYGVSGTINMDYTTHPTVKHWMEDLKKAGDSFVVVHISENEMMDWRQYRESLGYLPDYKLNKAKTVEYYSYSIGVGALSISSFEPISSEQLRTLERFRNVFGLAYRRYADVAQAEAQAREAQIELALERTRTQSMLMQHSNELDTTLRVFHEQVLLLGIKSEFSFLWLPDEDEDRHIFWATWVESHLDSPLSKSKAINYPLDREDPATIQCLVDWKSDEPVHSYFVAPAEVDNYFAVWKELLGGVEKLKPEYFRDGLFYVEAFMKYGCFGVMVKGELPEDEKKILGRFAVEFERTYTRFLDLQKAEAQAREGQIQLALERVRARTMAMYHSSELSDAAALLFHQLDQLGAALWTCGFSICDRDKDVVEKWMSSPAGQIVDHPLFFPTSHPSEQKLYNAWKNGVEFSASIIEGDELKKDVQDLLTLPVMKELFDDLIKSGIKYPTWVQQFFISYKYGYLLIVTTQPFEESQIFVRFAKVFEQTYTRFLDLKKAEAQAREAQIETGLEKVRSRTMGMHKSDELLEVVAVVFNQMQLLGFNLNLCNIALIDKNTLETDYWLSGSQEGTLPESYHIPYFDHPMYQYQLNTWRNAEPFAVFELEGELKKSWDEILFTQTDIKRIPDSAKAMMGGLDKVVLSSVGMKHGIFQVIGVEKLSDESASVLNRFAKVFEQTYTRFLDLQKAESQAREAQIEAALEKIRSTSLAIHRSDEIINVVNVLFEKLKELDLIFDGGAGIHLFTEGSRDAGICVMSPELNAPIINDLPYDEEAFENNPIILDVWKAKDEGVDIINKCYSFEQKNRYFEYLFKYNDEIKLPKPIREFILKAKSYTATFIVEKNSLLGASSWTEQLFSEANLAVLKRVARVFEQAYVRFLDLKKAEGQAREAQIEAALERVRARSAAMFKSSELAEIMVTIFKSMVDLGIPRENIENCYICTFDLEKPVGEIYQTNRLDGTLIPQSNSLPFDYDPMFMAIYKNWKEGNRFYLGHLVGQQLIDHFEYMRSHTQIPNLLDSEHNHLLPHETFTYALYFSQGYLGIVVRKEMKEFQPVFIRFGNVLQQSYTRFLDLQKAETQAREAIKRASVDRVRAEIASMRTTNDLERITPLVWNELTTLGVPFIRCGVFIMDDEHDEVQSFLSTPDGNAIASFRQPYDAPGEISEMVASWHRKEMYKQHWDEARFVEFTKGLVDQGAVTSGERNLTEIRPTDLYLHFVPFFQGMLYAGNTTPLSDDELQLVQNLADAFSTAYARYEDFNKLESAKVQIEKTLVDLKQAQSQLVQSEKMASLGELTAGIAHEIQNPLNFVNNFSEINKELITELKIELDKENTNEAKAIANDIFENEEKINNHGKRADSIVKSMLQHSRISAGQKQPTDINALADEYLRLSYHGLRAKNQSFNTEMQTHFDPAIGKIDIIPQDIGRVLLNLFNNAFYALSAEASAKAGGSYKPLLTLTTKRVDNKIEISVKDNGVGIPEKIKDKIFQPFFTTKPTGQGTGLGLSLSYDIIKAHGGDIKVISNDGGGLPAPKESIRTGATAQAGTEFVVQLPV